MILFGCISDNFYGRFVGHLPNELTTRNSLQRFGLGVQAFVYLFKGKRGSPLDYPLIMLLPTDCVQFVLIQ